MTRKRTFTGLLEVTSVFRKIGNPNPFHCFGQIICLSRAVEQQQRRSRHGLGPGVDGGLEQFIRPVQGTRMLALLFEVTPKRDCYQRYLDIAAALRPALDKHDGLLFIDRYRSLSKPDTILSHSLWRDEASMAGWRTFESHHHAQVVGREQVFADYRLRIADVVLARTPNASDWRPSRPSSYNEPAARPPRHVVIATSRETPCAGEASDSFESLNRPKEFLSLYDAGDFDAA
ncbi:MAG TPA: antibiotic biosynthesis monooxygenase, partial [Bradyrhizobium sp.]